MRSLTLALLVCAVAPAPRLRAVETVSNEPLGFRLTVPNGFAREPALVRGSVVHAFQRPPVGGQKVGTYVFVSRLGGVIGRERLDPKKVADQGPGVTVSTEKWKAFDIDVSRVPETADGVQVLTFNAQVPLRPEAVQVAVMGEAAREEELRDVLRALLANLEGQSNWLNQAERATRITEGIVRLGTTVGIITVIVVVIWKAVRKEKKPRHRYRDRDRHRGRDRDRDDRDPD